MSLRRPASTKAHRSNAEGRDSSRSRHLVNSTSTDLDQKADPASGLQPLHIALTLVDYSFILSTVLGGCCTNVWAYEELLKMNPRIGSALTFSQMLFITIQAFPRFVRWRPSEGYRFPRLKTRQVPLRSWALQVIVLTSGSLLNNWVFAFHVPLTVQIVFRSAGLAVSMLFGHLFLKKQYSRLQIVSVTMVTTGVILATLSRRAASSKATLDDPYKYALGISMLVVSLILTGVLGLLQEQTYHKYGPCWREGVFYTHLLSLPIFLFFIGDVKQGLESLFATSDALSKSYWIMGSNLISQLICVSGVNKLSSQMTSVSTNLILTIRKAISLCFSVWWFGNGWNHQLSIGAILVFLGSLLFSI